MLRIRVRVRHRIRNHRLGQLRLARRIRLRAFSGLLAGAAAQRVHETVDALRAHHANHLFDRIRGARVLMRGGQRVGRTRFVKHRGGKRSAAAELAGRAHKRGHLRARSDRAGQMIRVRRDVGAHVRTERLVIVGLFRGDLTGGKGAFEVAQRGEFVDEILMRTGSTGHATRTGSIIAIRAAQRPVAHRDGLAGERRRPARGDDDHIAHRELLRVHIAVDAVADAHHGGDDRVCPLRGDDGVMVHVHVVGDARRHGERDEHALRSHGAGQVVAEHAGFERDVYADETAGSGDRRAFHIRPVERIADMHRDRQFAFAGAHARDRRRRRRRRAGITLTFCGVRGILHEVQRPRAAVRRGHGEYVAVCDGGNIRMGGDHRRPDYPSQDERRCDGDHAGARTRAYQGTPASRSNLHPGLGVAVAHDQANTSSTPGSPPASAMRWWRFFASVTTNSRYISAISGSRPAATAMRWRRSIW